MTAFLYLPSSPNAGPGRRVDLANFASLFGDRDEPLAPPRRTPFARIALVALLLIGATGDTVLLARPEVLASVTGAPLIKAKLARGVSF